MRIVVYAALSLVATALPLSAETRTDLYKAQCRGPSKAPRRSVKDSSKAPDKPARGLPRGLPASREARDKRPLALPEVLVPSPQKLAKALGAS